MRRYTVTKRERWLQRVTVEADNPLEAIKKVANGDGEIWSDPSYDEDIELQDWKVQEEE